MEAQLYQACKEGKVEEVQKLLQNSQIDINWKNDHPPHREYNFGNPYEQQLVEAEMYNYFRTPFHIACENGHIEVVKLLLNDERVDINKAYNVSLSAHNRTLHDITPFYIACENGHIEVVKLLLNDERVDINKYNDVGRTPYYIACEKGHVEIVKLLLNNNRVDINIANNYRGTPFFIACEMGHIKIVKLLLNDNRVDINKAKETKSYSYSDPNSDDGWTPFFIACEKGHIKIVKLLLNENRVDINKASKRGRTPFYSACQNGNIEIVKLLLNDERVDINQQDNGRYCWTPFMIACFNGKTEVVKYLLESEREIDINKADKNRKTSLDYAKQTGKTDIVNLIESFQTNPNETRAQLRRELKLDEQQFWKLCSDGNIEEVRKLLQNPQLNINWQDNDGQTPLWIACDWGHTEVVKLLLNDERIEINKATNGWTPLYSACQKEDIEIVKLLLNESINVNKVDGNNYLTTPFYYACQKGKIEIVKLLLNDKRVDINKEDKNGETPLYTACSGGSIEIVKLLLNNQRVDINKTNIYGSTPFYAACYNGQIETVKHLLASERELNINQKDEHGKTALNYARKKGKMDIVELIESFQKNPNETRTKLKKDLYLPKGQQDKLIEYFPLNNWNDIVSLYQGANDEYRIEIDPDEIPKKIKTEVREIMEKCSKLETCIRYKATPSNFIFQVEFIMKSRAEKVFNEIVEFLESDPQ